MGTAVVLPSLSNKVKHYISEENLERQRFLSAKSKLIQRINKRQKSARKEQAQIMECHKQILCDVVFQEEIDKAIRHYKCNCEYAIHLVLYRYMQALKASEDELMRTRVWDLEDIENNLISVLNGKKMVDVAKLPKGSVLVADKITPTIAACIDRDKINGLVTKTGSRFSHVAIIAREEGIPAVYDVDTHHIRDKNYVFIDGTEGECHVGTSELFIRKLFTKKIEFVYIPPYKRESQHNIF